MVAGIDPLGLELEPAPLELVLHQHRVATVVFQNQDADGVFHTIDGRRHPCSLSSLRGAQLP